MFWQCGSALLLGVIAAQAQSPALKTYHDAKFGVTFQYPAEWTSDAGSPSAIVLDPENGPHAWFGFNAPLEGGPYSGTTLSDLVFVYNVFPGSTATQCRKLIGSNLNGVQKPVEATLRGVTYDHFSFAGAQTGHQAFEEIYDTASHGQCYLFEEVIHTASARGPKFLSAAQSKQLQRKLDRVMQSVRFENAQ